jgi:hypothetical protein
MELTIGEWVVKPQAGSQPVHRLWSPRRLALGTAGSTIKPVVLPTLGPPAATRA